MASNSVNNGGEVFRSRGCPVCLQKDRALARKTAKNGADHDDFECPECGRHWLSCTLSAVLFHEVVVSNVQRQFVRDTPYNHFGNRPMNENDLPRL